MTLIELLVVISILAILAITVVPNVARNANARRNREGARSLSSFVAKTQALAIGRRGWAGFALAGSGWSAFDLYLSEVPDVFRGDTIPATLTITGLGTTGTAAAIANGGALATTGTKIMAVSDLIRFDGRGPFYELIRAGTTTTSSGTITVSFRLRGDMSGATEDAGLQPHATPFPPLNTPLTFEVLRRPVTTGGPLQLPEGVVIDMRWSGYGPPQVGTVTNTYRTFPTSTTIHVLFDGTGRLRQVVEQSGATVTRRPVTGTVFLLVGRAIRAGNSDIDLSAAPSATNESLGANWQYPDSFWVAIDPMTGVAKSAECTPATTYVSGTNGCLNSQAWIRQALLSDGR